MGVILGDGNIGVPLRGVEPHLDAAAAATVVGCVAVGARPDLLAERSRRGEHKLELLAHGALGTLVGAWGWAGGEVSEGLWEMGVAPQCMGCTWLPLVLLGKRELSSRWHRVSHRITPHPMRTLTPSDLLTCTGDSHLAATPTPWGPSHPWTHSQPPRRVDTTSPAARWRVTGDPQGG